MIYQKAKSIGFLGTFMPPKLGNTLPLFINIRKWVGSLFTSCLLHYLTQVKVKEVCLTEWTLHLKKISFLFKNANMKMKVRIIVAII